MGGLREGMEKVERFFLRIVKDDKRRPDDPRWIGALLFSLKQLSRIYSLVVRTRLLLYRHRILRHHTLGCQVISIGNLTVGGTGKTPVVEIFARRLQEEGRKVAILSRGYKKREPSFAERMLDKALFRERRRPPRVVSDGERLLLDSRMSGDEPYMLATHLPGVSVLVDKNRVKSGRYAINRQGRDTLILDDGFQYLAMKHRIEIVLVDKQNPFGNGHVLPRGILREPIGNICRANVIFITKCNGVGADELKAKLRALNPSAEIIECSHRPRYLQNVFTTERCDIGYLRGKSVVALSGIAAPDGFETELERQGASIALKKRFADHHRYAQQEIIDIVNSAMASKADAIITTEKDSVRFPRLESCAVPIFFLRVDIALHGGTEDFNACISRICFRRTADGG